MFYIINKTTRELIRESATPFNVDEAVQPDAPLIQLKLVRDDTKPAYDAATEKLVQTTVDDDAAFTRNVKWVKQAMTPAEVTAYQQKQTDAATLQTIKSVYSDLKNGVGTAGERLVRLERAVAYLLRESVK